ncbi:MAG TPA: imidazole glycerol phosphate synthase subunit HisF [bacterium]|nr:imidazole glycerol phosphate synthase subunit HisF [bacterium]
MPTFAKRIIPCLDIKDGRVVKGTHFTDLVDSGDPVELGSRYAEEGADELVCLDIAASVEERGNRVELVRRLAAHVPIPLTVGGGIRSLEDISALLQAGADKVSIGTQAVTNPQLVREASLRFGAQAIVISVDARRSGDNWFIYVKGGSEKTEVRVLDFVKHMQDLGAGELLVNSLDRDGTQVGFDLALLISITDSVSIPVIASSGAGTLDHFLQAFRQARVDAVLAARVFHSRLLEIPVVKAYVSAQGIKIRD